MRPKTDSPSPAQRSVNADVKKAISYQLVSTARFATSLASALEGGVYVATGTCSSEHHLSAGEIVYISEASINDYNGFFVITTPPTSTTFEYTLGPTQPGGPLTSGYVQRVWGGGRQVLENNIIEVFPARTRFFPPRGIYMGWGAGDAVTTRTPEVVARRDVIRHVDGAPDQAPLQNYSRGFYVSAIGALMVEENVVDLDITEPAIQYYDCRTNHFFANQSSAGALIQGYDAVQEATASELPLTVKDAEGLAL